MKKDSLNDIINHGILPKKGKGKRKKKGGSADATQHLHSDTISKQTIKKFSAKRINSK